MQRFPPYTPSVNNFHQGVSVFINKNIMLYSGTVLASLGGEVARDGKKRTEMDGVPMSRMKDYGIGKAVTLVSVQR